MTINIYIKDDEICECIPCLIASELIKKYGRYDPNDIQEIVDHLNAYINNLNRSK